MDLFPQLPRTLEWFKHENCRIGQHRLTLEQRRIGERMITTIVHTAGEAPLDGRIWIPGNRDANVTTNGHAVTPAFQMMAPSGMEQAAIRFELPVGQKLTVERTEP